MDKSVIKAPCSRVSPNTCQWRNTKTLMCGMRFGKCPPRNTSYSKFKNKKVEVDGITFDSKLEARRYGELKALKLAAKIAGFERQVAFAYMGTRDQVLFKYIADFVVDNIDGTKTIEDTKGFLTPVYRLKKKLIEDRFGITITEVYAKKRPTKRGGRANR